ncbi:MAG: DUF4388 domain-containing protein [Deltaproteobacteria bacterium]|nr:DUF4388 domain-containing protein [Deltaproteobacteria bacterium]
MSSFQQQFGSNDIRGNGRKSPEPWMTSIVPPYRLGELLLNIGERGLTGRLVLQSDITERIIFFQNGFPVFAQSTQFDERLGAVAIRHGLLKRKDIAEALALSRKHGGKLGKALLELGCLDGSHLFTLLGTQLTERMAASCGSVHARARFQLENKALEGIIILRLHPMTAVLAAVRNMPPPERSKIFSGVGSRALRVDPVARLTRDWLQDLGIMGEVDSLFAGSLTVQALRSRLIVRLNPTVRPFFDPRNAPYAYLMGREEIELPTAQSVAEAITLSLLMAGSVKLIDSDQRRSTAVNISLPNTAADLEANLTRAATVPIGSLPEFKAIPADSNYDRAILYYLYGKRDQDMATRMAIWGPGVETEGGDNLDQLLTLYLTIKPDPDPRSILAVEKSDSIKDIKNTYRLYSEFLEAHLDMSNEPIVMCKVAELCKCIDQAASELIPESRLFLREESPSLLESKTFEERLIAVFPRTAREISDELESENKTEESRPGRTQEGTDDLESCTSAAPENQELCRERSDDYFSKVEELIQSGSWQPICDLLGPVAKREKLTPPLSLAYTIARRQLRLTKRERRSRFRNYTVLGLTLILGAAIGWIARLLGFTILLILAK